jgi:hypothetical protein
MSRNEVLNIMIVITDKQKKLIEHTISGPDRNWFGTSLHCNDSLEFKILCQEGFATAETPPKWMGDEVIYRLTDKGKEYLK